MRAPQWGSGRRRGGVSERVHPQAAPWRAAVWRLALGSPLVPRETAPCPWEAAFGESEQQ